MLDKGPALLSPYMPPEKVRTVYMPNTGSKSYLGSPEKNFEEIIEQRNMRNLEIFLQTTECLLEATHSLLMQLEEDGDA